MLINEIIILLLIGYDYTSCKKEEVNILAQNQSSFWMIKYTNTLQKNLMNY